MEKLVAEFEASGLMREAFCQQRGLSVATLDKYRQRVQKWAARSGAGPLFRSKWFCRQREVQSTPPGATVFWWSSREAGVESKWAMDSMRRRWSAC